MEEDRPDLISSLPYELLQLIVSTIPLKEAIRTSILSTTWRSIWAPFEVNLELNSDEIISHGTTQNLTQIIDSFLRSSNNHKALLKVSLAKHDPFFMATKGVDHEELHLVFSQESARKFSMVLEPKSYKIFSREPNRFSSLKNLSLRCVTHLGERFVSSLFSNCGVLESLKLEKCSGLENIRIKANNWFKRFIIVDCGNMISVNTSAPNLRSFWYQGVLPKIEVTSSPNNLVDVMLNLRDGLGNNEFDCEDVLSLLASLKDIEILKLSGWLLEWLCKAGVVFGKLEFKFNKLKELWWIDSMMNRPKRDSLACFLNITTSLEKLFVNIDQNCSPIPCPIFHQFWHEPHLWMDYATLKCNASQLNHLKHFNLEGFEEEEDHLLLMDLLLHKAIALDSMIVTSPEKNHPRRVSKIPRSQLNRLSRCHPRPVVVSSSTMDCFFVLTEENDNGCSHEN